MSKNVHHIGNKQEPVIDYKHHVISIEHRKDTNDYLYSFTHTKTLTFDGYGSTYENCLDKAKRYVDMVAGE